MALRNLIRKITGGKKKGKSIEQEETGQRQIHLCLCEISFIFNISTATSYQLFTIISCNPLTQAVLFFMLGRVVCNHLPNPRARLITANPWFVCL